MSDIDADKLNQLVGKMLGDLGGAFSVPTARIGYKLCESAWKIDPHLGDIGVEK